MPTVSSALDVEPQVVRERGAQIRYTPYAARPRETNLVVPQVHFVEALDEEYSVPTHYHAVDQFQVFLDSVGRVGSTPLAPLTVQYADAYTPYGPIIPEGGRLRFLTIRATKDSGAQYIDDPVARENRRGRGGRSFTLSLPPRAPATGATVDHCHDEGDGVAVHRVRLGANQSCSMPRSTESGVSACIVIDGGIQLDGELHPPVTQLMVHASESPVILESGSAGADVLVLGFRVMR